jgi:predicted metal-dependent enzyme (double-stranded beta helix superfamily)
MNLPDLITHVGALAASQMPPRSAVATLAPMLAAFVAEPSHRRLPDRARQLGDGARILLNHPGDKFQLVVQSWFAGSRSPIHDHDGAVGAVVSLSGATIETKYRIVGEDATHVRLARVGTLRLGGRIVTPLLPEDGLQLHDMAHAYGDPAVTLHVYLHPVATHQVFAPQADGHHRRHQRALWVDEAYAWRWWHEALGAAIQQQAPCASAHKQALGASVQQPAPGASVQRPAPVISSHRPGPSAALNWARPGYVRPSARAMVDMADVAAFAGNAAATQLRAPSPVRFTHNPQAA